MNKTRFYTALLAILVVPMALCAQSGSNFKQRYDNLVARVGVAGIGVETLLDNWQKEDSLSLDYLKARADFYYLKSMRTEVVKKSTRRFLGMEPMFQLKDSLDVPVYYFEENFYDEEMMGKALSCLEKAISLYPTRLDMRIDRLTTLVAYEKESPDMATVELKKLIDYNQKSRPQWDVPGIGGVDDGYFCEVVQEYCYTFFTINTASSIEAFREISEKMVLYYPKSPMFLDNLGSYYTSKKDYKNALKYYNKALKLNPKDSTAITNCLLIARRTKDNKLLKKYLPMSQALAATQP